MFAAALGVDNRLFGASHSSRNCSNFSEQLVHVLLFQPTTQHDDILLFGKLLQISCSEVSSSQVSCKFSVGNSFEIVNSKASFCTM